MTTLFDPVSEPAKKPSPTRVQLRPYQEDAVSAVGAAWSSGSQVTLVVAPTGTGKTEVFAAVIGRFSRRRSLVLTHRVELARQSAKRIEQRTGRKVYLEASEQWAPRTGDQDVVVAMIQSLSARMGDGKRLDRFDLSQFDKLIVDEGHHAVAGTWKRVIEAARSAGCKVLLVTATPDRADEEALGQVVESVAFEYELPQAIKDGWLVPIYQRMVECGELDLSSVKTTAGDLNQEQLAKIVEREGVLHSFCSSIFEISGHRKTIVFMPSVAAAEMACEIMNRWRDQSSLVVSGTTDDHSRNEAFRMFGAGERQYLFNVGIATEGWDDPSVGDPVQCVALCRPTKSRSLYAQMVGRGTRPVPGLVDPIDTADGRRAAIAGSVKPFCEVIDFVGNSGRHKLVTVTDLLAGNLDEGEAAQLEERVKKAAAGRPSDPLEELEKMRAEMEARRASEIARRMHVKVRVDYSSHLVNPFDMLDIRPVREKAWHRGRQLSDKQVALLAKYNVDASKLTYTNAKNVIDEIIKRDIPTAKMVSLLRKHGMWMPDLTFGQAREQIQILADNGWRKPKVTP